MPEGDTVHRAAREQHAALAGRVLLASDFRVPRLATVDLAGRRVDEVVAVGKHLFHRVGEWSIHSHLKMEGAWRVFPRLDRGPGGADGAGRTGSTADAATPPRFAPWRRPAFQARAVLTTPEAQSVGFELGVLELLPRERDRDAVAHLGPDLLDPAWGPAHAAETEAHLAARPEVPVFVALLDQRNLAGIGNEYANELCFLRGALPTRPMGETDVAALVALARRLLVANLDRAIRTTTGDASRGRTSWVYGRTGRPCRRCGTTILGGELGPAVAPGEPARDRVVSWCPSCQR